MTQSDGWIRLFEELGAGDLAAVGGKNASLGELIRLGRRKGFAVPDGFALTTSAFRLFLEVNELSGPIREHLSAYRADRLPLEQAGHAIREMVLESSLPDTLRTQIDQAYEALGRRCGELGPPVAVRSSATAEDLPGASFAGLHDSYLNVKGTRDLHRAIVRCFASLYTDRAVLYRREKGFEERDVALSVGVQQMIRLDSGSAGVMFTIEPDSGFPHVVFIQGSWGFGESVVKGQVDPDQFLVFKPALARTLPKPILESRMGSKRTKLVCAPAQAESSDGASGSESGSESGAGAAAFDQSLLEREVPVHERNTFCLEPEQVVELARWGVLVEAHYGKPMDLEWVSEERTGKLWLVQARPETVHSVRSGELDTYEWTETPPEAILRGVSVGSAIAHGAVRILSEPVAAEEISPHDILVTRMTAPDWVPAMKRAAGIITETGGRTCHAAIVSRELGIPAIVGATGAMGVLREGREVTLSCAGGDVGAVYEGHVPFRRRRLDLEAFRRTRTLLMINLATPETAYRWWNMPVDGVGLARIEFIITDRIGIHPMAAAHPERMDRKELERWIRSQSLHPGELIALERKGVAVNGEASQGGSGRAAGSTGSETAGGAGEGVDRDESGGDGLEGLPFDPRTLDIGGIFVARLASGIARIASSQHPRPVIVRTSDFKTNEYAQLAGGARYEPKEGNPMIGWRGASRYASDDYRDGFALECRALRMVREQMGLDNVIVMVPFCRTPEEASRTLAEMERHGLRRGEHGLKVYMMCEIPSNVLMLEAFDPWFDGYSIGSNDLTQLTLGVDRDSDRLATVFDESDPAVMLSIRLLIEKARELRKPIGICGQAPSDIPGFARFLVRNGITSISVNPDSLLKVHEQIVEAEFATSPDGSSTRRTAARVQTPSPSPQPSERD